MQILTGDRARRYLVRVCLGLLLSGGLFAGLYTMPGLTSSAAPEVLPETTLLAPAIAQSLAGEWQFLPDATASTALSPAAPELPPLDWSGSAAIAVPSNWYLQGYDMAGVAWYRHRFSVNEGLADQELTLSFAGVDYAADVWLNGQYLGFHEGYFQTFEFPVTHLVKVGQENELIVRVNSPLETATQDWSLHKRLIKGVLAHHDARPGGAWSDRSQEKNTGGIWAPVTLRTSRTLSIRQVRVTPEIDRYGRSAIANVQVDLAVPDDSLSAVQVKAQLIPANFKGNDGPVFGSTQSLTVGKNTLSLAVPQPDPKLWWTWDHGQPNLYRLRLQIWDGDRLLDARDTQFGFRTVEWDQHGQVFRLNGRRLFLKGTNYIPSQWLSELDCDRLQQDIDLMRAAYINSIRAHAHVTAPEFYRLADEAGLLIWQDFPLQWGYQDTPQFAAEAIRQARDMIAQLYNHPAIFAWSLHNEPPWDAFWMVDKYETFNPEQNKGLDRVLYRALRQADPSRYLHEASVIAEHPWWGWYSFTYGRYGEPTDQPLITEFGAQALPDIQTLDRIFEEPHRWPDSEADWEVWRYHNFQPYETFELAGIAQGDTLEDFVSNTQRYQARLHQYAAEAYRRQRYQPVSAIFQFMFCEPWPSVNWGMVDYWRRPKAGYDALKRAYQPILPSIEAPAEPQSLGNAVPIALWVINDTWTPLSDATLTYVIQQDDRPLRSIRIAFNLDADALKRLDRTEFVPETPGEYAIVATIQNAQHQTISENRYAFTVLPST